VNCTGDADVRADGQVGDDGEGKDRYLLDRERMQ